MSKTKCYFSKSLIAMAISAVLAPTYAAKATTTNNPQPIIQLSDNLSAKYSGKGVKLGVVDGGFVPEHPLHSDKLHISTFQLTSPEGKLNTYDPNYRQPDFQITVKNGELGFMMGFETHGLGVSGLIGAKTDEQTGFKGGVAKDAELYIATNTRNRTLEEVLNDADDEEEEEEEGDKAPDFDKLAKSDSLLGTNAKSAFQRIELATALNKLTEKNLLAINNSWNADPISKNIEDIDHFYQAVTKDKKNPLVQALINAKNRDTLLVFANGNESSPHPGIVAMLPRYIPELERHFIAVASVDNKREITEYSNRCGVSKNWCISAPGNLDVLNAEAGENDTTVYGLSKSKGTSLASPVVTGSLGVVKERFDYLTPTQIRDTLLTTATDLGEKGVDDVYGWGLVNLKNAVNGPSQFLGDETVTMTRNDQWHNPFSSQFKFTKKGDKSLSLNGENHFADLAIEQGKLALKGKTVAQKISNNAILAVDQTQIGQHYHSTVASQLEVLSHNGLIATGQANVNLAGSLKIADKLTEQSKVGDTSATVVQLKDKATYQGGFKKLVANANLNKRGLMQDLYFKDTEIIAKVNSNKPISDANANATGQAGLAVLNALRTAPIAYRRGLYNDWLQAALEQHKLDNLHYAVSNNIYADSIELLRSQNAKGLNQTQQNLFTAYHTPQKTTVWAGHLYQKQSDSAKHKTAVKHNQSQLGLSHKPADKVVLSAMLSQQKDRLNKPFAQATLKQTALNLGLRYALNDAWFSEAALQFARQKYQQTRHFGSYQLGSAKNHGATLGGEIRLGYQFTPNQWVIEPSLGIQWLQTKMDSLNERGELASKTAAVRYNDVNLVPSVKLQRTFQFEQGSISPYVGFNYLHRVGGKDTNITSYIAGNTLHNYLGVKRDHQLNSEVGLKLHYKNWFASANLDYDRAKSANMFGWKANLGLTF
ncbi:autotransporter-like protein [Bibersteinia trehalosi]|uniref:S8 family peptidase n=1 Tax=Bibersteinia trehalosi TaxID=47735 RepID=UPI0010521C35|nr:S8 family serine peptidase [Bibersteinia trehalosi]TCT13010.1 autotransporter-like protein [Bibersteinia trehalosi]